ncbi:MAG: hypothetical protein V3S10_06145 [Dehalococcoidales bacterium]
MDPGALVLILSIIVVIVLFSFLRGKGGGVRRQPEVVQFLLFDVKINQAMVSTFYDRKKIRHFERTNWEINKSKISFLGESLKDTLRATFALVEELNGEIKAVKKDKTRDRREVDVTKLTEPLAKCREGLEGWLMDTIGTTEVAIRYPSLSGFLFGER